MGVREDERVWLDAPENEINSHVAGWDRRKYTELLPEFERLSYPQIDGILRRFGIAFAVPIASISKQDIFATIVDDWSYEQVKSALATPPRCAINGAFDVSH